MGRKKGQASKGRVPLTKTLSFPDFRQVSLSPHLHFFKKIFLFIYLAALGLSCGTRALP